MAERSNPEALDVVRNDVERFLSEQTGKEARVTDARLLAGGASQESWSVDVVLEPGEERLALVMRRDMGGVLTFATVIDKSFLGMLTFRTLSLKSPVFPSVSRTCL